MSGVNRYGHYRSDQGKRKQNRIPNDWMNCPPIATSGIANSFVVFKTPLDYKYNSTIAFHKRFNPQMVFQHMFSYQIYMLAIAGLLYGPIVLRFSSSYFHHMRKAQVESIGLWIDLTNTTRYYDKFEIEKMECAYEKIACDGHGDLPHPKLIKLFVNKCSNFLKNNFSQYIGVHCTHGFNRTGFFVVSYLVEELHYDVASAIRHFAAARPPGIYRQNYIDELFIRYGQYSNEAPIMASKPHWIF
ncbi:mRNA-capping enzyme-like [Aphis gossypii]|uniref:mRNA-capping enzyme-like n=1 Tax=Aphis gossypii TaxID=80765 RepID=UPI00215983B8|nr:mRNA-capping enzyme-like [Aphis gossypii]